MHGLDAGSVLHLLMAGHARRHDGRAWVIAHRREKHPLADGHGDIIMLLLEAEGACHAAATRVGFLYLGPGD